MQLTKQVIESEKLWQVYLINDYIQHDIILQLYRAVYQELKYVVYLYQ